MGYKYVQAEAKGLEDDVEVRGGRIGVLLEDNQLTTLASLQVHPRQSRRHCNGSMYGLWQNQGRCYARGNPGHSGETEMDDPTWRKSIET